MDIIVDTREQKPLWTKGCIRYKLTVGDYSTLKLRESFCIERKSLPDLYSTITKGHVRFRHELIRAEVYNISLVLVVEGARKNFISKKFPGGSMRKISGETLNKIVTTVEERYGLTIHWCATRAQARNKIIHLLREAESLLPKHQDKRTNCAKSKTGKPCRN